MSETPPQDVAKPAKIDLKKEIARSEWKDDPVIGFEQRASLAIARWVLIIFGGVYGLSFVAMFFLFYRTDATFEKGSELVKFMVQSLLPLVTLAVGYYLGDRNRQPATSRGRR
jgi:hypothetical protein